MPADNWHFLFHEQVCLFLCQLTKQGFSLMRLMRKNPHWLCYFNNLSVEEQNTLTHILHSNSIIKTEIAICINKTIAIDNLQSTLCNPIIVNSFQPNEIYLISTTLQPVKTINLNIEIINQAESSWLKLTVIRVAFMADDEYSVFPLSSFWVWLSVQSTP